MITDANTTFFSGWDIDKLVATGVVSVSIPGYGAMVKIRDLTEFSLTREPNFFVAISTDGGVTWYMPGGAAANVTARVSTSSLELVGLGGSSGPAQVRYHVFSSGIKQQ
ncbi:hypothetical protein MPC38_06805 [Prescottella equi]|uniref:hypothetical protein n=1 Tax=Rhodococcus hoagii TaxID=43767 RepID=UPI001F5BCC9E|nr:hypothetical protein [Prescottella equi]UNQ40955.1 hypothetical protein MPC38_06805 [Prescottella equi]